MSQCTNPPELGENTLLLYLDGEAGTEVADHLDSCPHCRGRLTRLSGFQNGLRSRLRRIDCPPAMTLTEFQRGQLTGKMRRQIAAHLSDCPNCREELAVLKKFLEATAVPQRSKPGVLERVQIQIARILEGGGPGRLSSSPIGVRGSEDQVLLFEAGDGQITVRTFRDLTDKAGHRLLGLITGENTSGWEVYLWRDGKLIGTRQVDSIGNFGFEAVSPGKYDLIIEGSGREIHLQSLEIHE